MTNENARERMLELLADRAIFGLDQTEKAELKRLESQFPELASDVSFERAAAAYSLSSLGKVEAMPSSLRAKIEADAAGIISREQAITAVTEPERDPAPVAVVEFQKPGFSFSQWLGWGVAFAACALLVINVWLTRSQTPSPVAEATPTPEATREPSLIEKKRALIASAVDLVRTNWSAPTEDGEVGGEVVWSDSQQQGYMTFRGLDVNDASKEQYQLWIFDEKQDEATPVDGGVFDIDEQGEVTVPIDAKLTVDNPKMFAVTVEKPGGVVVSKREKIVAIAKV
ncbi:MAG: anti-sigma factor [Acidobacteriota bacterium]|nr:MAG: anti-sigma factor [Acidobacteriota bacterium]